MRINKHVGFILVFLLLLASAVACGPVMSTTNISDAKDAIAKAKAVNAEELAPYEYTNAVEYMKKADELWGHSKFGDSVDYAKRAIEFAQAAEKKAQEDPWISPLSKFQAEAAPVQDTAGDGVEQDTAGDGVESEN
ncbi:MAG: DUF4398 domain-containing protein [Bradymonadales bacterium]|jgi:hypothetical protein